MSAVLVELVDGQFVSRDAEEWRHECLARHILSHPLLERRMLLSEYAHVHGAVADERLRLVVAALHAKGRE